MLQGLMTHCGAERLGRQDLLALTTPDATETHKPIAHAKIVEGLIESLDFRRLSVVRDEYAVTADGMRMFGFLEISEEDSGVRFAIGCRNSHDKSFSLGLTVGYRVFVCDNLSFHGDFTPVTRKHTPGLYHLEVIDVAVGRMQRHFEPMKRQINAWKGFDLPDIRAKEVIYGAFIEGNLDVPKHLARVVHREYFEPTIDEFKTRTMWSLSNAFTSAFKKLDPVPQMQATARLAPFLAAVN
jgi:Domain of unknown function (DUF932)